MLGNTGSNSQPPEVTFLYDECLPRRIGEALREVGFPIEFANPGTKDEVLIPNMGAKKLVWITRDDRAKTEHEALIGTAKISVIWVRGLAHQRKKKGPISKKVGMKDILRMLVNKLDQASEKIVAAKGTPRYFLLYTSAGQREDHLEQYASLREVHERLKA